LCLFKSLFRKQEVTGHQTAHAQSTFMPGRVLILFAHPALQKSRVNRRLIRAVQDLDNVTINDLYEEYPEFDIRVQREQELLLSHDIIVFQHPFYWYSSPAILKQWEDLVLEFGFAYGPGGTQLKGKLFLTSITTGGSISSYGREGGNHYSIREFLAPFEQTAKLCGMIYLPPYVIPGSLAFKESEIVVQAERYRQMIERLRDGEVDLAKLAETSYLNELFQAAEAPV
jgi:glutathione-regulated potassium-efflux system ancillary protein KefG